MPGILPYQDSSDSVSEYSHWSCADEIFQKQDLSQYAGAVGTANGICRAGSGYQWGFSFLLTFVVCILNLIFTLIMYALWWDVHRHGNASETKPGVFKDAVTMVTMAQSQYGAKVGEWSSATLQRVVVNGRNGMTFAGDEHLRRRAVSSPGQQELGDPLRGDWGGNVVVEDRK